MFLRLLYRLGCLLMRPWAARRLIAARAGKESADCKQTYQKWDAEVTQALAVYQEVK